VSDGHTDVASRGRLHCGPTCCTPSVPASQLHTFPVYTVNTEPASLAALERRMDEKDAAQALCDEWTDQVLGGIFFVRFLQVSLGCQRRLSCNCLSPCWRRRTSHPRSRPSCWLIVRPQTGDGLADGLMVGSALYMPEKDNCTMPLMRSTAEKACDMFYWCEEDFLAGVRH